MINDIFLHLQPATAGWMPPDLSISVLVMTYTFLHSTSFLSKRVFLFYNMYVISIFCHGTWYKIYRMLLVLNIKWYLYGTW